MFNLIDQWTDNRSLEYGKRLRLAGGGCQLSEVLKCTYLRGFAVDDFFYKAVAQLPFPARSDQAISLLFTHIREAAGVVTTARVQRGPW